MKTVGFRINLNGKELVTVSNESLNILTVQVHGDVLGEELAEIEMHGGYYGDDAPKTHFIWLSGHEVKESDEVEIVFLENVNTSQAGKTIEELHSGRSNAPVDESLEELYSSLVKMPSLRSGYKIHVTHSSGARKTFEVTKDEYCFGFCAMWKWLKPELASVSLTSNTLEGVSKQESGTTNIREKLQLGESVKLTMEHNG